MILLCDTYLLDYLSICSLPHCSLSLCPHILLNAYRFIHLFGSVSIISLSWYTIHNFLRCLSMIIVPAALRLFVCTQGSLFPLDWTVVIPLCGALLWQSHTQPITAEQWCFTKDIKQARYWSWNPKKSINNCHCAPQEERIMKFKIHKSLHTVHNYLYIFIFFICKC